MSCQISSVKFKEKSYSEPKWTVELRKNKVIYIIIQQKYTNCEFSCCQITNNGQSTLSKYLNLTYVPFENAFFESFKTASFSHINPVHLQEQAKLKNPVFNTCM